MKTPFSRVMLSIIRKDLRTEFRSRELVSFMLLFALLSVLIFSFALELDRVARDEIISGVLWVTIVFMSVLGLNRSMSIEQDQGSLGAMLIAPIDRSAIFVGKLFSNFIFTCIIGVILLPVMTILYNKNLLDIWLIVIVLLGTFGISTIGTFLATMTVQTRTREALLPIVMLPMALPILLSAIRASKGILAQAPSEAWLFWILIVALIDIIYLVLSYFAFPYIAEE